MKRRPVNLYTTKACGTNNSSRREGIGYKSIMEALEGHCALFIQTYPLRSGRGNKRMNEYTYTKENTKIVQINLIQITSLYSLPSLLLHRPSKGSSKYFQVLNTGLRNQRSSLQGLPSRTWVTSLRPAWRVAVQSPKTLGHPQLTLREQKEWDSMCLERGGNNSLPSARLSRILEKRVDVRRE